MLGKEIAANIDKRICNLLGFEDILYENKTLQKKISNFFMENSKKLNVKTCFYCNIDFVNTFESNDKKRNHFTLDHLLPKGVHPYFSISLFNLIPSCYACNSKFKHVKEFSINDDLKKNSPSSETYNLDEKIKFQLFFDTHFGKNVTKQANSQNFRPFKTSLINIENNEGAEEFIKMFQLRGRYEFHKGISDDMLEKRNRYSDSQLLELSELLNIDVEILKKDIFGKESFEVTNAPFEKYKGDIAEELGLK